MPLDAKGPGFIRRILKYRTYSKLNKTNKLATLLVAVVALSTAIAFSISVESRTAGWLWKPQPSTPSQAESAKTSTAPAASASALRPLGPNAALLTPVAPIVTASKTDALFTDVDIDGKADPGDTLKYTVTIGVSGQDATGATFTDTVDANTAFVAGTLRTTPIARNDSYTATGNIRITVAAPGVLANDSDADPAVNALTATASTFLSAEGGNVNLSSDGSFTYNPPAGFEGNDSFTYTLNDNDGEGATDTATVSIMVSGMIWFIDNTASCPCDGRLTNPFNTLAAFDAVNDSVGNHPAANDNIFVYESATNYVGPVTLENGQKFIGQDATASLASITGITLAPGSDSLPATSPGSPIVNITGNGITVASNNTLRGFTGGDATSDIDGSGFGTLNVSDVTLNGTGRALNLATGTLNGTFGSISSTNSATTGISLTSVAGSLTTGSTTVTNSTGIGISVNTSSGSFNFAGTSVTGSSNTGISLTTNTGPFTFGALTITPDSSQRGLLATDNSGNITIPSGTVTTTSAVAVEITKGSGTTPLTVSLTSVSANGGTGGIVLTNTNGSFTITGGGNTSVGGNSSGGTIQNVTGHAIAMSNVQNPSFTNINIQSAGRSGVDGQQVTNFTLANSTINNVGTAAVGQHDESNISFNDDGLFTSTSVSGVVSITQNILTNARRHGIQIENGSGTISTLTITNNTLTSSTNSAVSLGTGILIAPQGSAGTTAHLTTGNISNNTITNFPSGEGIALLGGSGNTSNNTSSTLGANGTPVNVTNNTIAGQATATQHLGSNAIRASMNSQVGVMNVNISCNGSTTGGCTATGPITNIQGQGISVFAGGTITGTATIDKNVIIANQTLGAGTQGLALQVDDGPAGLGTSAANYNTTITNNSVSNYEGNGIRVIARASLATLDATINNNTVGTPILANRNGIRVDSGSGTGDVTLCMAMSGNTSAGSGLNAGIGLRKQGTVATTNDFGIVGLSPSPATAAQAEAKVEADNPAGGGVDILSGDNFVSCTQTAAPITASSVKSESLSAEAQFSRPVSENVLWASKGENKDPQNPRSLTESEVSAMAQAALARWAEAGLSDAAFAKLQGLKFEVANLPDGQLATANSKKITLDETAAGYGWFFDATPNDDNEFEVTVQNQELQTTDQSAAHERIDLLTVLMRQLGSEVSRSKSAFKGPQTWLMEGSLDIGTRRAPAFKKEVGKAQSAPAATVASQVRATTETPKRDASYQQVATGKTPRSSRVMRNHAMRAAAPASFADVMLSFGDIPAGKTVTVTFNVTVDDPFPGPGAQVCNQGTVSGANFANVLTDDPDEIGASDPTCTAIDLQADLAVTKTASPDPVIAGNNITYTINFVNNGPNATGATVTDATPAGTTFVSAAVTTGTGWGVTNPSVGGTGNVVFSNALVAKDETAVFTIVVKVNSSVAGGSTIDNSATAATTGATDPVPGNNTDTASTSVVAQADLSITKTDGADTEIPGTSVSYTITVTNSGPSDANGVSVADTFPGILTGVSYTSLATGSATGNTSNSGNISDTLNMPAGSSVTYTVNATIQSSATGELTNTATVTAPAGVTDPNTENNSATDTDTLVPTADLSITKTDGVTTEIPGTSVSYTITVTNSGPSDAPNTTVADEFPNILTGLSYSSVAAGSATGNTAGPATGDINDTLSMPSGSSVTYTVNATISASATGNLSNTATVTEGAGVTDNNQANNSDTDTDTLTPQADLSITKTDGVSSAVPGLSVSYTITVTNSGPSDAPGTTVADTFPGILTGVSYTSVAAGDATGNTAGPANGNINDILSMPSGSSVTYTVNATIDPSATGNLSNTATVTAGGGVTDPTPDNNSATDTDALTPSADVAVDKTGDATVTPGNNITYTITVSNSGPSDAVNLSLSDAVPTNTTFVSVTTPADWTRTDAVPAGGTGTITFTRGSFAAGATPSVFTLVVTANLGLPDATVITNTVNVTSATADPNAGNNTDSFDTTVQNNADLSITKSVAPTGPNGAGASVTYTVTVTNNGPSASANNVTFSDVVPAGLVVNMQTNPSGWSCNSVVGGSGTITCTKSTMAKDETATLTVVATINCGQANGSTINNTATVSAESPADGDTSNNTAMASFTVNNPAPVLTASIGTNQLQQNNHELINVGLEASATDGPCGTPTISVQVFGDEDDQTPTRKNELFSPDAKDIGPNGTLRLRAERVDSGDGRVYLIVVKATDAAGQTSFATFTVGVPKSSSPKDTNSLADQLAAAKTFADTHNGAAPAGFFVIGDGPTIGNKQ